MPWQQSVQRLWNDVRNTKFIETILSLETQICLKHHTHTKWSTSDLRFSWQWLRILHLPGWDIAQTTVSALTLCRNLLPVPLAHVSTLLPTAHHHCCLKTNNSFLCFEQPVVLYGPNIRVTSCAAAERASRCAVRLLARLPQQHLG